MKQCVKVYELVTDKNKDVKKVLLGIYKNMGVAAKAYKAHATIVSRICHGKTKWVVIDGKHIYSNLLISYLTRPYELIVLIRYHD